MKASSGPVLAQNQNQGAEAHNCEFPVGCGSFSFEVGCQIQHQFACRLQTLASTPRLASRAWLMAATVEARLAELEQEERDICREIKVLSMQHKRMVDKQQNKTQKLGRYMSLMLCFLYICSGHGHQIAQAFLKGEGLARRRRKQELEPGEFRRLVENTYLATDENDLATLMLTPSDLLPSQHVRRACKYVVEWKLFQFSLECNVSKGIAPTADIIAEHAEELVPHTLPALQRQYFRELLMSSCPARSKLLCLTRKRWEMRHGLLPSEPDIPLSEAQQKVLVWYHYCNYVFSQLEKPALLVNLDETSLAHSYPKQKGMVVTKKKLQALGFGAARDRINTQQLRGCVSLAALICNVAHLQPLLPQVMMMNEKQLTLKLQSQFRVLPGNIQLWRQKSAWNSSASMMRIITELKKALKGHMRSYSVVLVMDCASLHLTKEVLLHARRNQITVLVIPAKLTWLVQPADSHCFAAFKQTLKRQWLRARFSKGFALDDSDWIKVLIKSVEYLHSKPWAQSFVDNGILHSTWREASNRVMKRLLLPSTFVSDDKPSEEQIRSLLPKRRRTSVNLLLPRESFSALASRAPCLD